MSGPNLEEVMRSVTGLSFTDKLTLAAFLLEQMKQDAAAPPPSTNDVAPEAAAAQPDRERRRELQWIKEHRQEYAGQYVALEGDRLVAHGDVLKEVMQQARANGGGQPLFHRMETLEEKHSMGMG
jgi:hypothetical protein